MLDYANQVANIDGWLTESEGHFLYDAARKVIPTKVIVEIGSWKGRSTICLGRGSQDGSKVEVYAIDPHTGSSEHKIFNNNIDTLDDLNANIKKTGLVEIVNIIRSTSENEARQFEKLIGLIFIDGAHEYRSVRTDFMGWFPKVANGGLIAFHDSWHFLGPNMVTLLQLIFSSRIRCPRLVDTITCFEKVEKNSPFDRFKNICFVIYRTLFGMIGFLRLKYHGSKVL